MLEHLVYVEALVRHQGEHLLQVDLDEVGEGVCLEVRAVPLALQEDVSVGVSVDGLVPLVARVFLIGLLVEN